MPTSLNAITQNDKIIASAVENNFNFLLTNFQSSTSPSNPSNGQLWYDSTNNLLKVYVTSSTSWVTIGPAGSTTSVTVADTPPGTPNAGDLWFDTGTSLRLYVFTTASNGAWLDASPAAATPPSMGIGYDQTWQDVTASRVLGTTYTNTTGKPIMVSVNVVGSPNNGSMYMTVNGVVLGYQGVAAVASAVMYATMTAIVPPGATYSAASYIGGGLNLWSELR
jgi:hypothetical protein